MSKEYEIGKWTKDTFMIMKDKNGKVIHHCIYCYNKISRKKGVYDLVDMKFIPFEEKVLTNDYIDKNYQYVDTGVLFISKESKVVEIIKQKKVNVNQFLKHCSSKDKWGYNKTICDEKRQLTQEEYDLLKEMLL